MENRPSGAEHIVLLGDSIFDNRAYTGGEPDVVTHLQRLLPEGARATLCAVDGATTESLKRQLGCVPADATRLAVAIGGNDALQNLDLLDLPVRTTGEALLVFAERLTVFERSYREALDAVRRFDKPVIVCTIYNGALPPPAARPARVGLMMFNDVILRCAAEWNFGIVELRGICTEPGDYANPIEPSGAGGLKIARAVAAAAGLGRPTA